MHEKLNVIAMKEFSNYAEMYKVVDFLNKNLKEKGIILGLTKNCEKDTLAITIYEV